jgi:hypothetical protein
VYCSLKVQGWTVESRGASLEFRTDLQYFNEMIVSWPVQLALTLLYLGLAVLVFTHAARAFDDPHRAIKASVLALGVFIVLTWVVGEVVWLKVVVIFWLGALVFYYAMRAVTAARPGPPDPDAQERGAALESVLGVLEQERREGAAPAVTPDRP